MVNSSYSLDAYKSHDLSISMRTSSGDTINMDFSNKSALSLKYEQNQDSSSGALSFASMQSFDFSMQSNGIDAQDKKEIDAFMKIAQPYIDSFLKELGEDAPQSPINKIAKEIAREFAPMKQKDEEVQNFTKANIVSMFDKAVKELQIPKKEQQSLEEITQEILENAQNLLEKTLQAFDELGQSLYA